MNDILKTKVNLYNYSAEAVEPISVTEYNLEEVMQVFKIGKFSLEKELEGYINLLQTDESYYEITYAEYIYNRYDIRPENIYKKYIKSNSGLVAEINEENTDGYIEAINELLSIEYGAVNHCKGRTSKYKIEKIDDIKELSKFIHEVENNYLEKGRNVAVKDFIKEKK